jgi:hypothetical protein
LTTTATAAAVTVDSTTNLAADTKAVSNATEGKRLISPPPSLFFLFSLWRSPFTLSQTSGGGGNRKERREDPKKLSLRFLVNPILDFTFKKQTKQLILNKKNNNKKTYAIIDKMFKHGSIRFSFTVCGLR